MNDVLTAPDRPDGTGPTPDDAVRQGFESGKVYAEILNDFIMEQSTDEVKLLIENPGFSLGILVSNYGYKLLSMVNNIYVIRKPKSTMNEVLTDSDPSAPTVSDDDLKQDYGFGELYIYVRPRLYTLYFALLFLFCYFMYDISGELCIVSTIIMSYIDIFMYIYYMKLHMRALKRHKRVLKENLRSLKERFLSDQEKLKTISDRIGRMPLLNI